MSSIEGKTVLIADDHPGIADLVVMVLEDEGVTVETASDGYEALEKARSLHPDLMFLDIMMPGIDGWEVASQLLADDETADIPIVFLTARARTEEQLRGWEMPIFDYLTKPFVLEELLEKACSILSADRPEMHELREQTRKQKLRRLLGLDRQQ